METVLRAVLFVEVADGARISESLGETMSLCERLVTLARRSPKPA